MYRLIKSSRTLNFWSSVCCFCCLILVAHFDFRPWITGYERVPLFRRHHRTRTWPIDRPP
jgi:1-acyl-sn-glycerol-3-phosphate acyltransferase